MAEVEVNTNAIDVAKTKDVLETSWNTEQDIKSSRKALSDQIKRIVGLTECDKTEARLASRISYLHKAGWAGNDCLTFEKAAKKKDPLTSVFGKLRDYITTLQDTGHVELLTPYLEALANNGIQITFDHSRDKEFDEETKEAFVSAKAYLKTIDDYSDQIKEEDGAVATEAGFVTNAKKYAGLFQIYSRARNGKDVDDALQQGQVEAETMANAYGFLWNIKDEAIED